MLWLLTAIFRQNVGGWVCVRACVRACICIYIVVPEDDSKTPKHVAASCKFIKYLMKNFIRLYFII